MPLNDNADKLLFLIKSKGAQTAQSLATLLNMTSMGARQHLETLQKQNLVESYDSLNGVGRPKRYWQLTTKAQQRFPDTHSYLTIELIESIKHLFGEEGIDRIITEREKQMLNKYQLVLQNCNRLGDKVRKLTELRNQEGYMAQCQRNKDGSYLLLENHCPICTAASRCQRFCHSELQLFQALLGDKVLITRESHILAGASRCVYRISKHTRL